MHYPPKLYQKLGNTKNYYISEKNISLLITFIGKFIKTNYIPGRGVGHKVNVKALGKTQTFSAMVGYVTKDFDKAHYSVVSKGVSAQVIIINYTTIFFIYKI